MSENPQRKDPFRDLRDAMERFIQEGAAVVQGSEALAIDMYETADSVVVMTTLVGAKPEEIDVSVTEGRLTIAGETYPDADVDESAYLRRERRFGKFSRTVSLPRPVKAEEATAKYKGGVLTVTLPKVEEARARKVEIKSE
ncbi:MAG: Hsp20/alpha crystallin family protein [Anaerolineae bacterium]